MSIESLEMMIDKTKEELGKRPARKNISMIVFALVLFLGAIFLFFSQQDSVYKTAFAPLVAGWLMISVWLGHIFSSALFTGRTVELSLSLEIAETLLDLSKEKGSGKRKE